MAEKSIGEIIRERRIELGLTQEELAERLGYKHSHCYLCRTIYGSAVRPFRPEYERFCRKMT